MQGTCTRGERIGLLIIRIFRIYWYFFTVFVGAGLAAFFAHYIDTVLQLGSMDWPPRRVQHIGWIVGAVLCAIGALLGWCSVSIGEGKQGDSQTAKEATLPPEIEKTPCPPDRSLGHAVRVGLIGGLVGVVLGIILGATFALIWVSITMSPWGPAEWVEALNLGWAGFSTSHPIPIALYLGTMAALGMLGFLLGFAGAPLGWANATWVGKL